MIAGFLNGILAMITFKNKRVRDVGCSLYIIGSSMTTLFIMIMFGLKFWILILAQMAFIVNRSFLSFQCYSIDFLLQICLNMNQWLNAFVAIERAIMILKGTRFSKRKSKQIAKLAIIILLIFIIGTTIHDPIYRRLIEEDEENDNEKRIWCIVTYPLSLETFNSFMQIFHVCVPFMINLISVVILITRKTRQQSTLQTYRTYKQIYKNNFDNIDICFLLQLYWLFLLYYV
ncbi:unnamed protein product [Adineta steineri]|uniref:G-protein coupled receptors family 1 profile domain-containing protein n=1 Tax=Adineta steineri TaxID=433720 RepID=A0A815C0S6_9BILA|nr:unnamed protein product [Adineta steineri]CAF3540814.1 unnamed protein product [Adineta steineri]